MLRNDDQMKYLAAFIFDDDWDGEIDESDPRCPKCGRELEFKGRGFYSDQNTYYCRDCRRSYAPKKNY